MAREGLTGSRIRERRSVAGIRQADLARSLGISASYLNLIEHNRRRIGGKLLLDIARELGVEPSMLTEGAEATLIATLREAATAAQMQTNEIERADELAGRFPAWAEVMAAGHRRLEALERTVETLSDRLTHDPRLAASVHELLSTAAAIRSTASILADEKDLEAEWRNRFHNNLNEESKRLADSSRALVTYFETREGDEDAASSPREEVDAFLQQHDYRFPALETGSQSIDQAIEHGTSLRSSASKRLAKIVLARAVQDAELVPLKALNDAMSTHGADPIKLAKALDAPIAVVLRRLAAKSDLETGLVVCDRAGSILFRKAAGQFVIPRYGSACTLWPVFSALAQPGQVIQMPIMQLGRAQRYFECYAVAEITATVGYNAPPLVEATMLVLPVNGDADADVLEVGSSCNVCPKIECSGRREPSMLVEGF